MNILTVDNISKAYGIKKTFDNSSFFLQEGEKAGIIGINGTGKSTLLKMIAGVENPDSGRIIRANNMTVGYLPQQPLISDNETILSAVLNENYACNKEWSNESDAKAMLTKLGIYEYDRLCRNLSGGEKKRIALVRVLLKNPDIMLLDEPTNHLDSEMAGWLENQLKSYRGSLVMVTHDRYFLDSVADRIIEIDKGKIYSYKENYSGYLELKTQREEMADATERKRQSVLKTELEWVKRGAKARSTKQKARLKRYEELREQNAPVKAQTVELESASSRLGKTTISLKGISKSYNNTTIIDGFSYNFLKNDRIGIIGKNGCGKSTLLKIITGEIIPDCGKVEIGATVKIGYYAQNIESVTEMNQRDRVIDYIRSVAEYIDTKDGRITAARLLERFLFKGEEQYSIIEKLSGGEKRRLNLCYVLMSAPNVLILDEPTNDLDISTLMVLEDYLDAFPGIVIVVSHDRYFLDRVVKRIFHYSGDGKFLQSEGGYTDYEARYTIMSTDEKNGKDRGKSKENKARMVKPREKKLKFTYKEQREYEIIEDEISIIENKIGELEKAMSDNARDFEKLGKLSEEKDIMEAGLAEKMDRWVYLEELKAAIEAENELK